MTQNLCINNADQALCLQWKEYSEYENMNKSKVNSVDSIDY